MKIFWLKESEINCVGLMARPRGGEWLALEIKELLEKEVSCLISALEISEIRALGLEKEIELSESSGIEFKWFSNSRYGYS